MQGGLAADGAVLDDMHLLRMSRLGTSGHWERIGCAPLALLPPTLRVGLTLRPVAIAPYAVASAAPDSAQPEGCRRVSHMSAEK